MRYLAVKNWSEFQHYKDRNPPWIKLHRTLLDDYEFARLQDASKAHLMLIWLFASQKNGVVPDDPSFLKMKLGLELEPDLKSFVDHGLLIPEQDASKSLANSEQVAPREETEAYKAPEKAFALTAHQKHGLKPGWWHSDLGIDEAGKRVGLKPRPGESYAEYKQRIFDHIGGERAA